ncbi:MAG: prenyltransferase [Bacteroidota bacterium]|nr:prenyltransferase [Bacteroidota bacterium]
MNIEHGNNAATLTKHYESDIEAIIAKRYDNGADLWTTPDNRICKGAPFSTLESMLMLTELGLTSTSIMENATELILSLWREDGRFQIAPKGAIYPCHTAGVARVLCRLGYTDDDRLKKTFNHLLEIQQNDGGWRCNTYKFGRGPETVFSNPGTTLAALDAFRFTHFLNKDERLDKAVESLLSHWETRKPLGPCHYGIGTLFMKVEYPFFRYNLFFYVYVLSFYERAKNDTRFLEALNVLKSKTVDGKIIVDNPNSKLADFTFCKKGEPSGLATERYQEILNNIK